MRSFPCLVVLLVALASGSALAQSAGQITIWVNGAAPAPQLRFVDPPGVVLPAVKNCASQFNNGGNSNDWATAAGLLQILVASQQQGCGQSFSFTQPGFGGEEVEILRQKLRQVSDLITAESASKAADLAEAKAYGFVVDTTDHDAEIARLKAIQQQLNLQMTAANARKTADQARLRAIYGR